MEHERRKKVWDCLVTQSLADGAVPPFVSLRGMSRGSEPGYLAGGGLKMGQVVGASTAKGERPKDRPITVSQLMSTMYRAIGIDPSMTFPSGSGRPMYVLDDREPVKELLG